MQTARWSNPPAAPGAMIRTASSHLADLGQTRAAIGAKRSAIEARPAHCDNQALELAPLFAQAELRRRNSTREIPMAFFVVNCDLRRKDEFDYQELWDEFERLGAVKYQKSDYFLSVANTADEIRDYFKRFVHEDDSLMVIEFEKKPKFTKSVKGTNAWIEKHWA
jgi:hypothetical protein